MKGQRTFKTGRAYSNIESINRFTLIDATGNHREYNNAYPKRNARVELEVDTHMLADWINIKLEEYGESDSGRGRSKAINVVLDGEEALTLYRFLKAKFEPDTK